MVADRVRAGWWHQLGEPAQQFAGLEDQHLGTRRKRALRDFDVSADGREIVFERVEESSDVWVMDLTAR